MRLLVVCMFICFLSSASNISHSGLEGWMMALQTPHPSPNSNLGQEKTGRWQFHSTLYFWIFWYSLVLWYFPVSDVKEVIRPLLAVPSNPSNFVIAFNFQHSLYQCSELWGAHFKKEMLRTAHFFLPYPRFLKLFSTPWVVWYRKHCFQQKYILNKLVCHYF